MGRENPYSGYSGSHASHGNPSWMRRILFYRIVQPLPFSHLLTAAQSGLHSHASHGNEGDKGKVRRQR